MFVCTNINIEFVLSLKILGRGGGLAHTLMSVKIFSSCPNALNVLAMNRCTVKWYLLEEISLFWVTDEKVTIMVSCPIGNNAGFI